MQPHFDGDGEYHSSGALVYVGDSLVVTLEEIWDGVEAAECIGIELGQIGRALSHNWSATVVALAFRNFATLRALIDEA
jgi:hypothetical protein